MKIIDLLNKIANGKEIPRIIRYMGDKYTYNSSVTFPHSYIGENDKLFTRGQIYLNDEVEILHEEDEFEDIEHYDMFDYFSGFHFGGADKQLLCDLQSNFEHINNELDKLIKNQKKIIEKLKEE